jgi:hypothetical protein
MGLSEKVLLQFQRILIILHHFAISSHFSPISMAHGRHSFWTGRGVDETSQQARWVTSSWPRSPTYWKWCNWALRGSASHLFDTWGPGWITQDGRISLLAGVENLFNENDRMTATVYCTIKKRSNNLDIAMHHILHPSTQVSTSQVSAESQKSQVRLIPSLQSSPSKLRHQAIANITYHRPAIWHMLLAMADILHPVWFCKIL